MTVLNFPSSPADGDTFTENDITYTWVENGTNPGFWSASGEQINLQSVTDNGATTDNALTISIGDMSLSDGNLVVANGHGIDFSDTPGGTNTSNTSEILDDYEIGDWAPIFEGSSVSGTYIASNGHFDYVKVGDMITLFGRCGFSSASGGTGTFNIRRLPYAYADNQAVVGIIEWDNIAFNGSPGSRPTNVVIMQFSDASSSTLQIVYSSDTEPAIALNASQITTTSTIRFQLTYRSA